MCCEMKTVPPSSSSLGGLGDLVVLHEGHICESCPLVRVWSAQWLWATVRGGLVLHAKDPLI